MPKGEKINLIEKGNVVSSDEEICSTLNDFFADTVSNLNIRALEQYHSNLQNTDPILATINSHDKHPSIERIKNRSRNSTFKLRKTNSNEVIKIIEKLVKIVITLLRLSNEDIAPFISENFNSYIDKGEFLNDLKHADIVSVHKKKPKIN